MMKVCPKISLFSHNQPYKFRRAELQKTQRFGRYMYVCKIKDDLCLLSQKRFCCKSRILRVKLLFNFSPYNSTKGQCAPNWLCGLGLRSYFCIFISVFLSGWASSVTYIVFLYLYFCICVWVGLYCYITMTNGVLS